MRRVYLDTNATAPLADEVHEAMLPWLGTVATNPSSAHASGQRARTAIEQARAHVAALVGPGYRAIFTSGGTEADNLALHGMLGWPPSGHLVVSAVEHPAVREPAEALAAAGVAVTTLPVDTSGRVDPGVLADACRPDTRLVSVMAANNEVGTLQPVTAIVQACDGVPVHCDAVQAVAWLELSSIASAAALYSISGHKIGGPPGIGALLVADGIDLVPTLRGGGQQGGARPGTEPTALIVGLAAACERVARRRAREAARVESLARHLEAAIHETIPGCRTTNGGAATLPNTLHLCVEGCRGDALVARLDLEGVAASAGSACHSGVHAGSHVLEAMGVPAELRAGALRLSLGYDTVDDDVDIAVRRLRRSVEAIRDAVGVARP